MYSKETMPAMVSNTGNMIFDLQDLLDLGIVESADTVKSILNGIRTQKIVTVEEVFTNALKYKEDNENPQPSTLNTLQGNFNRFFNDSFSSADITSITPEYLNKYSFELIRRESERGVAMTEKAFKNYKGILNLIFQYAASSIAGNAAIIKDNPVKCMQRNNYFLKHCKEREKAVNPLLFDIPDNYTNCEVIFKESELDEAERIIRERMDSVRFTKTDGYYPNGFAFLLSRLTGMRAAEIMALRWTDIKENYIWIHAQQLRKNGNDGEYIYCPWTKDDKKHTGRGRKFPLFASVKSLLEEISSVQNHLGITSEYLLCHADGEWLKKESYETMFRRLFQSLGYNVTNNHALRKSLNSNILIPLGIDVTDRAAMLGHSVETNLKYYSYQQKDNTNDLIARLNRSTTNNNIVEFSVDKHKTNVI